MNYNQLIKNWHTKASDEDYFSKFVFEYLAFIAYLRTQKYPNSANDRVVLQKLKQDTDLKQSYLVKLSQAEKESWSKLKIEFETNGRLGNASGLNNVEELKWWNFSGDDLITQTTEDRSKTKGVLHSLEDWENMVEFWRAIRDNLFHGSKDPEQERDQLVIEHGYKTLKPLVEIFLAENN
jgi:hypothetical protein